MDKYLKGSQNYHLVEEGKGVTKCGYDFSITAKTLQLEATKLKAGWPTCPACAAGVVAIKSK